MPRGAADPRLAIWAYPRDVLNQGLEVVSRELRERAGLNGINIAATYHAGRTEAL